MQLTLQTLWVSLVLRGIVQEGSKSGAAGISLPVGENGIVYKDRQGCCLSKRYYCCDKTPCLKAS